MNEIDRLTFLQLDYADTINACSTNKQYDAMCKTHSFWREKGLFKYGVDIDKLLFLKRFAIAQDIDSNWAKRYYWLSKMIEWTPYNDFSFTFTSTMYILVHTQNDDNFYRAKLKHTFHFEDRVLDIYANTIEYKRRMYHLLYGLAYHLSTRSLSYVTLMSRSYEPVRHRLIKSFLNNGYYKFVVTKELDYVLDYIITKCVRYGKSWVSDHPVDTGFYNLIAEEKWLTPAGERYHEASDSIINMLSFDAIHDMDAMMRLFSSYLMDLDIDAHQLALTLSIEWNSIPEDMQYELVRQWYSNTYLCYILTNQRGTDIQRYGLEGYESRGGFLNRFVSKAWYNDDNMEQNIDFIINDKDEFIQTIYRVGMDAGY